MQLKKEERETVVSIGMLVLSLFLFASCFSIRESAPGLGSPRLMPYIVTGLMIIISIVMTVRSLIRSKGLVPVSKLVSSLKDVLGNKEWIHIFQAIGIVLVYIALGIPFLGFYPSSFIVMLFCTICYVKGISKIKAVIYSAILTVILYLVFALALGVQL